MTSIIDLYQFHDRCDSLSHVLSTNVSFILDVSLLVSLINDVAIKVTASACCNFETAHLDVDQGEGCLLPELIQWVYQIPSSCSIVYIEET